MKKIITITVLLIYSVVYSQSQFPINEKGNIYYTSVVELGGVKSSDIQKALKLFAETSNSFNRRNSSKILKRIEVLYDRDIFIKTVSENLSVIKVINYYRSTSLCLRILVVEYDFILRSKDGKYKYELTNFRYTHHNRSNGRQQQIYGFTDRGLCNSKNSLKELLKCNRCEKDLIEFYKYLHEDNLKLLTDIKKGIKDNVTNEDW